jgi:hypothetical protein
MRADEFKDLLSGLPADCPLGKIAQIRLEDDKDVLKEFTPQMRKIRADWLNRKAKAVSAKAADAAMEEFKQMFIKMAGD